MKAKTACTSGSALISTLLAVVVLTIIVTAFLQSMTAERRTASSYLNRTRAALAAEAGAADAMNRVVSLVGGNPYHSIGYRESDPGTGEQIMPVFIGSANPMVAPQASASEGYTYLLSSVNRTNPTGFDPTNSVDLNVKSSKGDTNGWIGSATVNGSQVHQPRRAQWVDILQHPRSAVQPDPNAADYNPVVGRYAFWIEDETSKLDVAVAGNIDGEDGGFERSDTSSDPTDLDVGALPMLEKKPLASDGTQNELNERIVSLRIDHPDIPLDSKRLNQVVPEADESSRYHSTVFSRSLDLAGNGRRRANLNAIVTDTIIPTDIAGDLDDIIFVISGRHIFTEYPISTTTNTLFSDAEANDPPDGPLVDFGKRFYTTPPLPPTYPSAPNLKSDHEATYLMRIAANIRDYIDTDSTPTVISEFNGELAIISGFRPSTAWTIGSEPIAIGKEAVPYFCEYAFYVRMLNVEIQSGNSRLVDFTVDHYLEFYNPTTLDYVAPQGTLLKLYSLPRFRRGSSPDLQLPDLELDLSGEVFPAGVATIVTTAPTVEDDPPGMIQDSRSIIRKPPTPEDGTRKFLGITGDQFVASGSSGDARKFGVAFGGRASTYTDYESEFVLSTPDGYVDAFSCLSVPASPQNVQGKSITAEMTVSNNGEEGSWALPAETRKKLLLWSTTPRGNDVQSRSADARSVNENLEITRGSNRAYGNDQSRFFGNITGNANIPGTSTWGIPNSQPGNSFTSPTSWPDYHPLLTNGRENAYAFVRNGPMHSVGELGNIYDPFRKRSFEENATIGTARGGGRTLKIGQKDDTVLGTKRFTGRSIVSTGWNSSAWRLADYFTTGDSAIPLGDETSRGKININGVLRDDGVAFRAALRNFEFLPTPEGDPARSGALLNSSEIDQLIAEIKEYLTTYGPFLEVGEISQLDFFSANQTAGGTTSNTTYDRSREEIARRIIEIVTTRSASFSIYVIGQAVRQSADGSIIVLASVGERFVNWLNPVIGPEPEAEVTSYSYDTIYRKSL